MSQPEPAAEASELPPRPFTPLNYKNPSVVPYKSAKDLVVLKDWFYNFTPEFDHRYRAVQRVKALASRGRVPHGVEATSFLTSVCLSDNGAVDSNCVQLAYAMALIRFVNGLIDPFQQGQFAVPMHQIAKTLGLPTFFVELRHMGTHESLPSLELCRIASRRALNWLYDHYWVHLEEEEEYYVDYQVSTSPVVDEKAGIRSQYTKKLDACQLVNNLKTYKRLRKANLDSDHKPVGTKQNVLFWRTVKSIKSVTNLGPFFKNKELPGYAGSDLLVEELLFDNFLIYNAGKIQSKEKLKFNPLLIKLYKPLLLELDPTLIFKLLVTMFRACASYFSGSACPAALHEITHPFEAVQMLEWTSYLCSQLMANPPSFPLYYTKTQMLKVENKTFSGCSTFKDKFEFLGLVLDELVTAFNKNKNQNLDIYAKILATLETELRSPKLEAVARKIKYVRKFQKFEAPSLDDLLGPKRKSQGQDDPQPGKKHKRDRHFFLEKHENWTPVPFGVPI